MTSFGYQSVVPSLTHYLRRNVSHVRIAILSGSGLALILYIIWEVLILGIIPMEGPVGLLAAFQQGKTAVAPLRYALATPWVHIVGEFFAFFALTSSFLGVSLGLRDFLADGLKVKKNAKGRFWICTLMFVPALLIAWSDPRFFLLALQYGGGDWSRFDLRAMARFAGMDGTLLPETKGTLPPNGREDLAYFDGLWVYFDPHCRAHHLS